MTGVRLFWCTLAACAGAALALLVWNRSPAAWFCDYGEPPRKIAALKPWPHGAAAFAVLFAAGAALPQAGGAGLPLAAQGLASVFLLLTALADFRYRIIPDQYVLALAVLGGVCAWLPAFAVRGAAWYSPLLGAACGAALLLLMGFAGRLLYRKESLGFGDVKLFAALGLFAGFPDVFLLFLAAILLAFFAVVFLLLRKKLDGGSYFPLGPFLCLAALLFFVFRSRIPAFLEWYFSLLNF